MSQAIAICCKYAPERWRYEGETPIDIRMALFEEVSVDLRGRASTEIAGRCSQEAVFIQWIAARVATGSDGRNVRGSSPV